MSEYKIDESQFQSLRDTIKYLRDENRSLREALEKHGRHYPTCMTQSINANRDVVGECTCGLNEALKISSGEK